jgi:RNA polymerase sigma-70 factor (ECF subfamily)
MAEDRPEGLLEAAQSGDTRALIALLESHRHGVYRYGLHVCPTTEDTEDAVQETLWAATRAIRSFRGPASSFSGWLFAIVRRACFRLFDAHRRTRRMGISDGEPATDSRDPEDLFLEKERTELLAAALNHLHPDHREVVLLRDVQGVSGPEAADRLGITLQALKSRLHRARAELRAYVLAQSLAS